jgi:hypothetical protein
MAAQVVGGGESKNDGSMLTFDEVAAHNTAGDTWVIINGNAYDLTDFAAEHPGGSSLVTEQAGKDCTAPFEHAHPESIMTLTLGKAGKEATFRGKVDPATIPSTADAGPSFANQEALSAKQVQDVDGVPPLEAVLNLHDFAAIAQRKMVSSGLKQTWDYYSSGADDELTYNENVNAFQRIWLKPRILVDVKECECVGCGGKKCDEIRSSSAMRVRVCGRGVANLESVRSCVLAAAQMQMHVRVCCARRCFCTYHVRTYHVATRQDKAGCYRCDKIPQVKCRVGAVRVSICPCIHV